MPYRVKTGHMNAAFRGEDTDNAMLRALSVDFPTMDAPKFARWVKRLVPSVGEYMRVVDVTSMDVFSRRKRSNCLNFALHTDTAHNEDGHGTQPGQLSGMGDIRDGHDWTCDILSNRTERDIRAMRSEYGDDVQITKLPGEFDVGDCTGRVVALIKTQTVTTADGDYHYLTFAQHAFLVINERLLDDISHAVHTTNRNVTVGDMLSLFRFEMDPISVYEYPASTRLSKRTVLERGMVLLVKNINTWMHKRGTSGFVIYRDASDRVMRFREKPLYKWDFNYKDAGLHYSTPCSIYCIKPSAR